MRSISYILMAGGIGMILIGAFGQDWERFQTSSILYVLIGVAAAIVGMSTKTIADRKKHVPAAWDRVFGVIGLILGPCGLGGTLILGGLERLQSANPWYFAGSIVGLLLSASLLLTGLYVIVKKPTPPTVEANDKAGGASPPTPPEHPNFDSWGP